MFKKTISHKDDEFVIRLEEEDIGFDGEKDEKAQPETYVYLHLENRFGNSLGWITEEDAALILDNLAAAFSIQQQKNKALGWP